jgi:hypothetical protein
MRLELCLCILHINLSVYKFTDVSKITLSSSSVMIFQLTFVYTQGQFIFDTPCGYKLHDEF